jgi:hypothetical protein
MKKEEVDVLSLIISVGYFSWEIQLANVLTQTEFPKRLVNTLGRGLITKGTWHDLGS